MHKYLVFCATMLLFAACEQEPENVAATPTPSAVEKSSVTTDASANYTDEPKGTFTVDAKTERGTLFENKSTKEQTITLIAKGEWSFAPAAGMVGADGAAAIAAANFLLPGTSSFALIVKRGDGTFEKVGAKSTLTLKPGEIVYFMMNELRGGFADNRGSLSVSWAKQ
jgi:hypothetical protein